MRIKKILILFAIVSLLLLSCDKPEFTNLVDTDMTFPAPTNLSITQTSITSCNLSWQDNSTGEQGFKIDRKKDSEEWVIAYQTVGENVETLTETNLTATSTYQYRVYGFADENTSSSITGEINMTFPAPTNLLIEQTSLTSCELNWNYSGFGDEEGFKIERRLSGGSWTEIAQLEISDTNYEDTGFTESGTYEYQIYAYNSECNGIAIFGIIELNFAIDIDGNVYQVLQIGGQIWMVENLKVTHYRNEDAIPHLTNSGDWTSTNSGAYCVYDNIPANADTYGNLYNWYAVNDSRGIAPEGWHVPTDVEIMELEMYLGMSQSQANSTGLRGTNEGSKLAGGADLWNNGDLENNAEFSSSGFSFLPGGYRDRDDGYHIDMGYGGSFWSSNEGSSSGAWGRYLHYDYADVSRHNYYKRHGFSVRCVRD